MVGFLRAESGMKLCQGAAAWHGEDGGLENHPFSWRFQTVHAIPPDSHDIHISYNRPWDYLLTVF